MLNFNHLFYFHIAATEGTLVRAAERLGVTQPTVSEQIRLLEKALGCQLFERTPTGLRLTDDGRHIYVHTTTMFRAADRILEHLGQAAPGHLPSVRIGISAAVSRSIAADFLMPVLSLEDCVPTIENGEVPQLFQALRRDELDLVLAETAPVGTARVGLVVVDLHRPRLALVAAPDIADDAWTGLPLIHYAADSAYRWEVEAYLDARGLRPRIAAETDDTHLMLEGAARGTCVAFVPAAIARDAVARGRLRVVDTLPPGSAQVHAIHPDQDSAAAVRRVVTLLAEHAATLVT